MNGDCVKACSLAVEAAPAEAVYHGLDLFLGERTHRSANETGLQGAGSNTSHVINALTALVVREAERLRAAACRNVDGALCAGTVYRLGELRHHWHIHIVVNSY